MLGFVTSLFFYGEELLAPRPAPKLEGHPLSAVRDCLFNIFAATLHTWRVFPPSATWGRAMPWLQGTHLTWTWRTRSQYLCPPPSERVSLGTGFPLCSLLRLAGLRCRYSPPHVDLSSVCSAFYSAKQIRRTFSVSGARYTSEGTLPVNNPQSNITCSLAISPGKHTTRYQGLFYRVAAKMYVTKNKYGFVNCWFIRCLQTLVWTVPVLAGYQPIYQSLVQLTRAHHRIVTCIPIAK
jgi:hypothetical protein